MSAAGDRRHRWGGDAGTTLLEMLVVMGLLALTVGLVFPNLRKPYEMLSAEVGRAAVAADLRSARAEAIRTGRNVAFEVAENGREYSAGGRSVLLPEAVRLVGEPRSILFGPDGDSAGGRLVLYQRQGRAFGLRVLPTVGVIQIESGR